MCVYTDDNMSAHCLKLHLIFTSINYYVRFITSHIDTRLVREPYQEKEHVGLEMV